jgi:TrmH RNA methyltransferase
MSDRSHRGGPGRRGPGQGPSRPEDPWGRTGARLPPRQAEPEPATPGLRAHGEVRIHGLNACLALFARRPEAVRKVWLLESRIPVLKNLLAHCVKHRLGYRVVAAEDLERLAGSAHHEGVCIDALPRAELPLSTWLRDLGTGPALGLWLDGVGNPHNFGAILRSAAHFGASVLLPKDSALALAGATARVAEGGAEAVPLVRLGRSDNAVAQLRSAGFELVATVVRGGEDLFAATQPRRLVLVLGAEAEGVDDRLAAQATHRWGIPGTGDVESLNVAAATAVFLSRWYAAQRIPAD